MVRTNPKHAQRVLPLENYDKLDAFIATLNLRADDERRKEALIQVLHQAQHIFGFLPEEVQLHVANRFAVSHAEVSGVISFYNYFTTTPKGKHRINVCMGTACYVNGADKVLQEFEHILGIRSGQVTPDGKFSIDSLRCVGACGLAPVITINDKVYGKVQPGKAEEILEHYLVEVVGEEAPVHA
jgi:NADH:ubiquinone oxidoreductase subunit E